MSSEAWCIPPRNVQQYVEELMGRGESDAAGDILLHYASCVGNADAEARKKAAIGLGQLAELYSKAASQRLQDTYPRSAWPWLRKKILSCKHFLAPPSSASARNPPRAVIIALCSRLSILSPIWKARAPAGCKLCVPASAWTIAFPNSSKKPWSAESMPDGLVGVLMRVPQGAAEHLAVRLARTSRRTERESVVHLAKAVGAPCVRYLKESLKNDAPAKAATVIGLLSRLDPAAVDELLPAPSPRWRPRIPRCGRAAALHCRRSGTRQTSLRFARNVRRHDRSTRARRNRHVRLTATPRPSCCALRKANYCRKVPSTCA